MRKNDQIEITDSIFVRDLTIFHSAAVKHEYYP